jgi:hypothetical protein
VGQYDEYNHIDVAREIVHLYGFVYFMDLPDRMAERADPKAAGMASNSDSKRSLRRIVFSNDKPLLVNNDIFIRFVD